MQSTLLYGPLRHPQPGWDAPPQTFFMVWVTRGPPPVSNPTAGPLSIWPPTPESQGPLMFLPSCLSV